MPVPPRWSLPPPRPADRALRALAAAGYLARGTVYLVVGVIALLSVWGTGQEPEGPRQALANLLSAPFGRSLVSILGLGLLAYSVWRFLQAVVDVDRRGTRLFSLLVRAGFLIGAVTYLTLSAYAFTLASGHATNDTGPVDWTRPLFAHPAGRAAVVFAGLCVACIGVAQIVIAWAEMYKARFTASWHDPILGRWIARLGLAARAIVFWSLGGVLIWAAVTEDPSRARGLGGALEAIGRAPLGSELLTLVATGLVAYAVYSFLMARYRDARWRWAPAPPEEDAS